MIRAWVKSLVAVVAVLVVIRGFLSTFDRFEGGLNLDDTADYLVMAVIAVICVAVWRWAFVSGLRESADRGKAKNRT